MGNCIKPKESKFFEKQENISENTKENTEKQNEQIKKNEMIIINQTDDDDFIIADKF